MSEFTSELMSGSRSKMSMLEQDDARLTLLDERAAGWLEGCEVWALVVTSSAQLFAFLAALENIPKEDELTWEAFVRMCWSKAVSRYPRPSSILRVSDLGKWWTCVMWPFRGIKLWYFLGHSGHANSLTVSSSVLTPIMGKHSVTWKKFKINYPIK